MKKVILAVFVAASTMFVACEGKQGPEGPQGPQGPQGVAGESGQDGQNAQFQIYSGTIQATDWVAQGGSPGDEGYRYEVGYSLNQLTQEILDRSLTMVYLKDGDYWRPLPITLFFNGYERMFEYRIGGASGRSLRIMVSDNDQYSIAPSFPIDWKCVIAEDLPGKKPFDFDEFIEKRTGIKVLR